MGWPSWGLLGGGRFPRRRSLRRRRFFFFSYRISFWKRSSGASAAGGGGGATLTYDLTSHPPVMMSAFLPGPLKKGSGGRRLPTRTAGGSVLRLAWQILSFSLGTEDTSRGRC